MKIWSTPHGDMGNRVNYNGPKVVTPGYRARGLPLARVISQSEAGYMLETPSIRRYSSMSHPSRRVPPWAVTIRPVRTISRKGQVSRSGSSASSTAKDASALRSSAIERVEPVGKSSRPSRSYKRNGACRSYLLEQYFGCGQVGRFDRHDNHREPLCRYVVRRISDLEFRIIPFFEEHPLVTAKANDFIKFATIVRMMRLGHHRDVGGLAEIARIVETMNRRQPSRFLESSEAIRQPRRVDDRREDMVRTS